MCITADGDYSVVVQNNGHSKTVIRQLGKIVEDISKQLKETGYKFIRIGRSLIVNKDYIHVINIPNQILILSDGQNMHTCKVSQDALKKLKAMIENDVRL